MEGYTVRINPCEDDVEETGYYSFCSLDIFIGTVKIGSFNFDLEIFDSCKGSNRAIAGEPEYDELLRRSYQDRDSNFTFYQMDDGSSTQAVSFHRDSKETVIHMVQCLRRGVGVEYIYADGGNGMSNIEVNNGLIKLEVTHYGHGLFLFLKSNQSFADAFEQMANLPRESTVENDDEMNEDDECDDEMNEDD